MTQKIAFVVGVANKYSIAWKIAQALHRDGSRLFLSYQGERLQESVVDLAATLPGTETLPLDATKDARSPRPSTGSAPNAEDSTGSYIRSRSPSVRNSTAARLRPPATAMPWPRTSRPIRSCPWRAEPSPSWMAARARSSR